MQLLKQLFTRMIFSFTLVYSDIEMDLCGHATLATAHCILYELRYNKNKVVFESMSGRLEVERVDNDYQMILP